MEIPLIGLPESTRGIYGPNKNLMPKRALFLHPDAYPSFMALQLESSGQMGVMVWSDIHRSAEASLAAVQSGRGAQPPGYSGHNYGLAVDCAVDETLKLNGWRYPELLAFMAKHGWYCYRRDGMRGKEDWHFNYMGPGGGNFVKSLINRPVWAEAAEHAIMQRFGQQFTLGATDVQRALAKLRLYNGTIDGDIGPLSSQAISAFCRAWRLGPSAYTDKPLRFQRTLAFVSADIKLLAA